MLACFCPLSNYIYFVVNFSFLWGCETKTCRNYEWWRWRWRWRWRWNGIWRWTWRWWKSILIQRAHTWRGTHCTGFLRWRQVNIFLLVSHSHCACPLCVQFSVYSKKDVFISNWKWRYTKFFSHVNFNSLAHKPNYTDHIKARRDVEQVVQRTPTQ